MTQRRSRWYVWAIILCICLFLFPGPKSDVTATTTTTFPVDEAGIAAYVKLDSIDITQLTDALAYFSVVEEQASTYVIGVIGVENLAIGGLVNKSYPHIYIGLDGWIVAYYLNTEAVSRIMQWKDYISTESINTTILDDAISIMCSNIGTTYSDPLKYYDFEFPEANRLTLIVEATTYQQYQNSFSLTIPGTLYEGSYSYHSLCWVPDTWLRVDDEEVFYAWPDNELHYGYYDPQTQLEVNEPHLITFYSACNLNSGIATALVYKSE